MSFNFWQAPDRDSPVTIEFSESEVAKRLSVLLQMEGEAGNSEEAVKSKTGESMRRPRRWNKIFERMGVLFVDSDSKTVLTDLGKLLMQVEDWSRDHMDQVRSRVARAAVGVLRKYQLKNPLDEDTGTYPDDSDLHPYWAVWRAASQLDWKLHWDELNRVLMHVLRHQDLEAAIAHIREARSQPDYDPANNGGATVKLGDRCYNQESAPEGREPADQIRDQITTPYLKRAGFGELLLDSPGTGGGGYWTVPSVVRDIISEDIGVAPDYKAFTDGNDWLKYYGALDPKYVRGVAKAGGIKSVLDEADPHLKQVQQLLADGFAGIIFSGPPGTSKSWYAAQVASKLTDGDPRRMRSIQFHPSYQYEDFVEGYVPSQAGGFQLKPKHLIEMCEIARELRSDQPCIIVIDEISRTDPARVFGEAFTYIETSKRDIEFGLASGTRLSIPPNLYFIATMNPFDRGVEEIDAALERRFAKIIMEPNTGLLRKLLAQNKMDGALVDKVCVFFEFLQRQPNELARVGHAYFVAVADEAGLQRLWSHQLKFHVEKACRLHPEEFSTIEQAWKKISPAPTSAPAPVPARPA